MKIAGGLKYTPLSKNRLLGRGINNLSMLKLFSQKAAF